MEYLAPYNCPCSGMWKMPVINIPFPMRDCDNVDKENANKEEPFMKITYNGYAGELWEFKRLPGRVNGKVLCNITILCQDGAKVGFEHVLLEDLRFSSANVSFGG